VIDSLEEVGGPDGRATQRSTSTKRPRLSRDAGAGLRRAVRASRRSGRAVVRLLNERS
jgi:hypothetical protein